MLKIAAINQLTPPFLAARSISAMAAVDKFGCMHEFTYKKESDRIVYYEIHTIYDVVQKKQRYTHSF
jgi:hypothetical protein